MLHEVPPAVFLESGLRALDADQLDRVPADRNVFLRVAQQLQSRALKGGGQLLVAAVIDALALVVAQHAVTGRDLGRRAHQRQRGLIVVLLPDDHVAREEDQVGLQGAQIGKQQLVVFPVFPVVDVGDDRDPDARADFLRRLLIEADRIVRFRILSV